MMRKSASGDRTAFVLVIIIPLLAYAYFFQGKGWNAMAHFDTIRALVERHTAALDGAPLETGDVNVVNGRTFSNKPPGIALLGVLPYRLLVAVERFASMDVQSDRVVLLNLRLCTILLSAVPAAILNSLIFYAFRRENVAQRTALLLTGGFAFGSLSWPYAGHLTSHPLCALLVMGVWVLLSETELTAGKMWAAGALALFAVVTDMLAAPVMLALAVLPIMRRTGLKRSVLYCASVCGGAVLVLAYNRWVQGAVASGVFAPPPEFTQTGRIFGLFGWPDFRQWYWITFQSMRGLFPTCPAFLICCFAGLNIRWREPVRPSRIAIALVLGVYLIFYATYSGWSGGWCVGPRYLIPALPLIWMFARRPMERYPRTCGLLIGLSIFQMLCFAAVGMLFPAPAVGGPDNSDPIRSDAIVLIQGYVNSDPGTENLGACMHLPEQMQLIPALVLMLGFYTYAWTRPTRCLDSNHPTPITARKWAGETNVSL